MKEPSELDDFRTAVAILHAYAMESPTLNQRGIVRMLERLINVAAQLSADELERNENDSSV